MWSLPVLLLIPTLPPFSFIEDFSTIITCSLVSSIPGLALDDFNIHVDDPASVCCPSLHRALLHPRPHHCQHFHHLYQHSIQHLDLPLSCLLSFHLTPSNVDFWPLSTTPLHTTSAPLPLAHHTHLGEPQY